MADKAEFVKEDKAIDSEKNTIDHPYFVVGLGAGQGAQEAMQDFFYYLDDGLAAYVIVQHVDPAIKKLIPNMLQKYVQLPIIEVEENVKLEPRHIYLVSTEKEVTLQNGVLELSDKRSKPRSPLQPIDLFFTSLASEYGHRSVGILLSGHGTDGTTGLQNIHLAAGLVMVQEPATARQPEMPAHAAAANTSGHVKPPKELALELTNFFKEINKQQAEEDEVKNQETLENIWDLVKVETGYDFTSYKQPTLSRRTTRRMVLCKAKNLSEYLTILKQSTEEVRALSKDYLIGVTRFFRDPKVFEVLQNDVVPAIVRNNLKKKLVKVWSVACSTGEEAYTLAIIFREYLDMTNREMEVKLFATDLDDASIKLASKGVYSEDIERDLPSHLLTKYFTHEGNFYRIRPEIRKMVVFSVHNIVQDPPFYQIDLITCRNLLIYMKPELQRKVFDRLHFSLNKESYLVLGSNETMGDGNHGFELIDKKWKIYRNLHVSRVIGHNNLTTTDISAPLRPIRTINSPQVQKAMAENRLTELLNEAMMEHFGVACVYIDESYRILNALGDYNRYLQLPDKKFSLNLMKMVSQEMSLTLSTAVRRALKEKQPVVFSGLRFREDGKDKSLSLEVHPLQIKEFSTRICCMVLFIEEKEAIVPSTASAGIDTGLLVSQRVIELEQELTFTQENLQANIEELETSHEELQSTNEEMMAANEELQSTNEELQSVNEELHTINAEYQEKIRELAMLNDDMDNLLKNTNFGTLFLDTNLHIRRYTPTITQLFHIIPSDIGRPISHINSRLNDNSQMLEAAQQVMDTLSPLEKEIPTSGGRWYLMRIQPYFTKEKIFWGTVISFVDITEQTHIFHELKQKTADLMAAEEKWNSLITNSLQVIFLLDHTLTIQSINRTGNALKSAGITPEKLIGTYYPDLIRPDNRMQVKETLEGVMETKISSKLEIYMDQVAGIYEVNLIPLTREGQPVGIIGMAQDISERKELEHQLANHARQLDKRNLDLEDFNYFASHDLKAPIINLQSLLSIFDTDGMNEFNLSLVEKMEHSVSIIQNTIRSLNQVLEAKSSQGLAYENIRFDDIFKQTVQLIEEPVKSSGAIFKLNFSKCPELFYPPIALSRILLNLITNSIKYSKPGESPHIYVTSGLQNGFVYVQVKDDGLGIDLDLHGNNIFGMFKRFHSHVDGAGIGLQIVKSLTENYGGLVDVQSQPNRGATFTVFLYKDNQ